MPVNQETYHQAHIPTKCHQLDKSTTHTNKEGTFHKDKATTIDNMEQDKIEINIIKDQITMFQISK